MDSTVPHADGDHLAETRCANCGSFVTPQFARVFGDNQNRVRRCLNCTTSRELCNGQ
ncbi:MAG: hypothetical protein QXG03_00235 [Halalkalicoccus sp.]